MIKTDKIIIFIKIPFKNFLISETGLNPHNASKGVSAIANSGLWFGSL